MTASAGGCSSLASRAMWEQSRGGLAAATADSRLSAARVQAALARIAPAHCAASVSLRVSILQNDMPAAHSFKDGALYVSTGLLERVSDDELAAVLAHELGHLMIDGLLGSEPAALLGSGELPEVGDVELHADLLARGVLATHHIRPAALTKALEKVAAASRKESYYVPLTHRITTLEHLDGREVSGRGED